MEISLFAPPICWPCLLSLRIFHTPLRSKLKIQLPRHLSFSKLPFFILLVTVRTSTFTYCTILLIIITGERRIRVVTSAVPVSSNLSDIFASADQVAIATLLANKAVERSITHKLEDARDALFGKLVEILGAYKASMRAAGAGASAQLAISENLKMLPVLILGLLKNVCSLPCYLSLPFIDVEYFNVRSE